ncbi:putative transmembrane protein [Senna tora]|uniref:Putative transmembrane protein n=1 Tax=Senna tora TaxID=362788 RepID=A0A834T8E1_9FABA|nr:putative transmembrane protein [Senna tora]
MSERTLVPIFLFWAFLTIITPTLILLTENSKADFDLNGN